MVRSALRIFTIRVVPTLLFLSAIVLSCDPSLLPGKTLEIAEVRQWLAYDSTMSYSGTLESANDSMVRIRSSETGVVVNIEFEKLTDYDKRVIKVADWFAEEEPQYKQLSAYISEISSGTGVVTEQLIASHHASSYAPYAGLWGAASLALTNNDFSQATTILQQVVKRIDEQRNLDRYRHRRTLASALNNLAICYIKAHEPSHAASSFVRIFEEKLPLDSRIEQNILQFATIASVKGSPFEVGDALKRRFVSNFPKELVPQTIEDKGWFYVLDVDLPSNRIVDYSFISATSPQPNLINVWAASGVALDHQHVVIPKVGLLKANGGFVSQFTALIPKEGTRAPAQLTLRRMTENEDLVILEITADDAISKGQNSELTGVWPLLAPQVSGNTKFAAFRLASQGDAASRGLEVIRGKPILQSQEESTTAKLNSETTWAWQRSFGLPGGCVCDDSGNFIGIATFNESIREVYEQGPVLAGDALKESLTSLDPPSTDKPSLGLAGPSVAEKIAKAKAACILVLGWSLDKEAIENTLSANNRALNLSIRDPWCVQCAGRGMFDCPNNGCHKGVESYKDRVQVGFNPNTRQPIFADKVFTRECRTCSGVGLRKCPFCNNGKLK